MKLCLQRVKAAGVRAAGEEIAAIGPGLLVLAGFGREDPADLPESRAWAALLKKVVELRIFPDAQGRLNVGLEEHGGELLLVSQFTLCADCRRGRRPSFDSAAPPEAARRLFDRFVADMESLRPGRVRTGAFGREMEVWLTNWGPVTILLSDDMFRPAAADGGRP